LPVILNHDYFNMSETTLALLGFGMVASFITLIMTKKLSPQVALTLVPVLFGLIAGASSGIGQMMAEGVKSIAPTAILIMFGIMYFGLMFDVGLFEPLIKKFLQFAKGDPLKVIMGTCILTLIVALDGDGAATYLIIVGAMLPIYKRLGINPLILTCIIMLCVGVMHILPWTGPNARVISVLKLDTSELFLQLIPAMLAAILWVLFVSYIFGKRERKRLGIRDLEIEENPEVKKPGLLVFNLILTLLLMTALVLDLLPIVILFMIAVAIALIINFPKPEDQRVRLASHAGSALSVGSVVFAAGIFTGILSGTKMLDAMAQSFIHIIPESLGPNLATITALTSMPFTFFISNDAYYFGIVPLTAVTATHFGVPVAEIGRASLLGQSVHLLSPLVASTYLLVGLAGVSFGDHQKFTLKWAVGTVLVMTFTCILTGAIRIHF
jgi:CitMHS family citrate-Mg2+:H+ or citrate-Ca2+:H+ symporter